MRVPLPMAGSGLNTGPTYAAGGGGLAAGAGAVTAGATTISVSPANSLLIKVGAASKSALVSPFTKSLRRASTLVVRMLIILEVTTQSSPNRAIFTATTLSTPSAPPMSARQDISSQPNISFCLSKPMSALMSS